MPIERVGAPPSSTSWIRDALRGARSPAARRVATAITAGLAAWETGRKLHAVVNERLLYTVAVPGTDDMFDALQEWLVAQVPPARRRSLVALTGQSNAFPRLIHHDDEPDDGPAELHHVYDGSRPQTVRIGGYRVQVEVERDSQLDGVTISFRDADFVRGLQRIVFRCSGVAARDAVLEFLAMVSEDRRAVRSAPRMWLATRWGDWRRVHDVAPRPLSTVVLADGLLERLVDDIATFQGQEHDYGEAGLPWHRGYLLHGPPGTGKTSAARAIAQHFGLDVYYLPLSSIEGDTQLFALLLGVKPRSLLLIEDVDVVHGARSRDDAETTGVTTSGLLNALDGFTTPHGLLTVMTTNDLDVLDAALIRPGRADVIAEFGLLDDDQALRIARLLGSDGPLPKLKGATLAPAELLEAAKPHLGDPGRAHAALVHRIYEARADR